MITVLITFGIGISAWIFFNFYFHQAPKLIIPKDNYDEMISKEINTITDAIRLIPLREKNLSKKDIEIRVWHFPPFTATEGVILQKNEEIWRAYHIKAERNLDSNDSDKNKYKKVKIIQLIGRPLSGWETFTEKIFNEGILKIKDAIEQKCELAMLDGSSFVVEINTNKVYRVYKQYDRTSSDCPETQKMRKVADIIEREFKNKNLKDCKTGGWLSC